MVYDPKLLTYKDILIHYFDQLGGPPRYKSYSRQYRSAILTHNNKQKEIATKFLQELQKKLQLTQVYTDVEPATDFYRAEEYHQKYIEKQSSRYY